EKKQGAKVYPAIPNSPIQCYQYYGTGTVSLTSNEMSHLICATECVKRDLYSRFKYFAIAEGDRCFCESELPPAEYKLQLNETCSYRCPRNDKQSCGGSMEIVYLKLEITNTPPESGKYEKKQGAKVYPAIPNSPIQCYQYYGTGTVSLTSNEMSHLICATECVKRDLYGRFKYFAIAEGDRCFCESELPPAEYKLQLNETCSYRCPRNDKQSCDEKKQGAKVYPAIPNSRFACYYYGEHIGGYSAPKKKSDNMSHLVCATECVKRDLYSRFKYFAIAEGDRCFCESELPPAEYKLQLNETCSYRCPGNSKQICGSSEGIVYFKLETTNTPPEPDD
uniref:WSC domain-containing protein n=1 Tax=Macrostomum lignano TaxID=282301 RepID=A0A1I8J9M5_9PLAT